MRVPHGPSRGSVPSTSGPPLTTPDKLKSFKVNPLDPTLADVIDAVSNEFRTQSGQYISLVEDDVLTLDGPGGWALILPERPVLSVASVVANGVVLSNPEWSGKGIIKGPWTTKYRSIVVTYSHGYAEVPNDIALAVAERVAIVLTTKAGHTQRTTGPFAATYNPGSTQRWIDTVNAYRWR